MHKTSALLLSIGLWMPSVSVVYFFGLILALPFALVCAISAALLPIIAFAVGRVMRVDSGPGPTRASGFLLVSGIALLAGACALLGRRYGDFDAALIWNLHARHLANADSWRRMYLPGASGNAAYPFGLPGFVAVVWRASGSFSPLVPYAVALFATMSIPVVIYLRTARRHLAVGAGVLAAFGLYPYYIALGLDQYADIQVAWLTLLCTLCLARMRVFTSKGYFLLLGALLGALCWTKYEGWLLSAALLLWHLRLFKNVRSAALLALGAAPFALAWMCLRTWGAPASPLMIDPALIAAHGRDASRYLVTARAFGREAVGTHLPLAVLLLADLVASWRFRLRVLPLHGAIWTALLGYAAVYIFLVSTDMDWNLRFSLPRLMLHLYPTVVFIAAFTLQRALDLRAENKEK